MASSKYSSDTFSMSSRASESSWTSSGSSVGSSMGSSVYDYDSRRRQRLASLEKEKLPVKCPYDNHDMPMDFSRKDRHMDKCRKNYVKKMSDKGKPALKWACQYNCGKTFYGPELAFHEKQCRFKTYRWGYEMYLEGMTIASPQLEEVERIFQKIKKDPLEWRTLTKTRLVDKYMGSTHPWSFPKTLEEIKNPSLFQPKGPTVKLCVPYVPPAYLREEAGFDEEEFYDEEEWESLCEAREAAARGDKVTIVEEESDEEDWLKNANAPHFDYLENLNNPKKPTTVYPFNLTKAERRKFDLFNSLWKESILEASRQQQRRPFRGILKSVSQVGDYDDYRQGFDDEEEVQGAAALRPGYQDSFSASSVCESEFDDVPSGFRYSPPPPPSTESSLFEGEPAGRYTVSRFEEESDAE